MTEFFIVKLFNKILTFENKSGQLDLMFKEMSGCWGIAKTSGCLTPTKDEFGVERVTVVNELEWLRKEKEDRRAWE